MGYSVKEIFFTLQGEGHNTGRPSVFCRFTGCNLWSGREEDRAQATCQFCDTDFLGTDGICGGYFEDAAQLSTAIFSTWPKNTLATKFVVCTGGEPLLQLDNDLIRALHNQDFEIAVETNGTVPMPEDIDWICVSPKAGTHLAVTSGDELKLVYPQEGATPSEYENLNFKHFYLQPMDAPNRNQHTALAINYCKTNPQWFLSLQTHKFLNIP